MEPWTPLLWIVIFCSASLIITLILVFLSQKYFGEKRIKTSQDDKVSEIFDTIGRFFKRDKKKKVSSNLAEMEKLKQKMEQDILKKSSKMAEKAREIYASTPMEERVIEQGGKQFSQFSIDFNSAMPRDEVELEKDMSDLMDAVKTLENFDREQYVKEEEEGLDVGKSMFYDRITSRLYRIMRKEKLTKEKFIVFDKLIYLALTNLKNITHQDLVSSLRYMKEAGYIKNYIEINAQLIIITQLEQDLTFTSPEKVVLVFAYEDSDSTISKLVEYSKWQEDYALKVINGLIEKGIAQLTDEKFTIVGFETPEEKIKRVELEDQISQQTDKKKIKRLEQKQDLSKHPNVIDEEMEHFLEEELQDQNADLETEMKVEYEAETEKRFKNIERPTVKALPLSTNNLKTVQKENVSVPKPSSKKTLEDKDFEPASNDEVTHEVNNLSEEDFESVIGSEYIGDEEDLELSEEAIIDGIMSIYENFEHMNGGLMDINIIHRMLLDIYPNVTMEEIKSTIPTLKQLGLVTKSIDLDPLILLLFKEIELDADMLDMLKTISTNGWMTKDELFKSLKWDEEKTLNTMKKLQDIEVLRLNPENKVVIPGLFVN